MKELIPQLRQAAKAYYQESREIMSNFEYDKLYDELSALEAKTGIILSGSPTQQVGYQVLSELPKETHEEPMLSLDKTKSVEDLQQWLGSQKGLLSWKMDGLTVVLTYENGTLAKAVTRGNGEIGEVITPNARAFSNIPLTIAYKGQLIIRGEAVITYTDFERINEEIGDADAKYKNPRNLCSGSVRQLNSKITAERSVHFEAFALVKAEGVDFKNSRKEQFLWLKNQGFEVVHHEEVTVGTTILGAATLGVGLLVGGVIFSCTGSKLSSKADEAWEQMISNERKINDICNYLYDLQRTAERYNATLLRMRSLYLKQLTKMRNIIESYSEKRVNWHNLSMEEQLIIENMVLIVGVLYNMCKVKLVRKSNSSDQNIINKTEISKAEKDANDVMEQMSAA